MIIYYVITVIIIILIRNGLLMPLLVFMLNAGQPSNYLQITFTQNVLSASFSESIIFLIGCENISVSIHIIDNRK